MERELVNTHAQNITQIHFYYSKHWYYSISEVLMVGTSLQRKLLTSLGNELLDIIDSIFTVTNQIIVNLYKWFIQP